MPEMIAGARKFVTLPAPSPLGGGVLSVAHVIDTSGPELMGAQAESDACFTVEEWTEFCDMTPVGRKIFDGAPFVAVGDPFVVYAGVSCDFQRLDEAEARARRHLAAGESQMIDFKVIDQLADTATPVEASPGQYSIVEGIGIIEQWMSTNYGGQPTLLIPRRFIPCACAHGVLYRNLDGTLETCSGSRVAPLSLTLGDATDAPGVMYATGTIVLLRGPVSSYSVPQQIAANGTFAPMRALAERVYVPLIDCNAAMVPVACGEPTP